MRGYAAVALVQPKSGDNVGGALRAAGVYGASLVVLGGSRAGTLVRHRTNTIKAERHTPVVVQESVMDCIPFGCVPVAIEITDDARCLTTYTHPERAYYIFGPEDPGAVSRRGEDPNEVLHEPGGDGERGPVRPAGEGGIVNSAWWQAELERVNARLRALETKIAELQLATGIQNDRLASHDDRLVGLEREGFRRVPRSVPLGASDDMGDGWKGRDL